MPLRLISPLHKAYRQIGLHMESRLNPLGVSPIEAHLLSYLAAYGPCPISELLRVFGHKKSTLTSILDRLERKGLISRQVNPDDRRSFLIGVSRSGRSLAARVDRLVEALEGEIEERITERDLRGFERVARAIAEATEVEVRPDDKEKR